MAGAIWKAVASLVMMTLVTLGILYYKANAETDPNRTAAALAGQAARGGGHADPANSSKGGGSDFFAFLSAGPKRIAVKQADAGLVDEQGRTLPKFKVIDRRGVIRTAAVAVTVDTAAEAGAEP